MATKTKQLKKTILDKDIRDMVKLKLEHAICDCWRLVYGVNPDDPDNQDKNKSRSSTKTDGLHKHIMEALELAFGHFSSDFTFKAETSDAKGKTSKIQSVDLYGTNFNLDGTISTLEGANRASILLKAPLQSLQKNRYNAIANMIGECARLLSPTFLADKQRHLVMVPMTPVESFCENNGAFTLEEPHSIYLNSEVGATGQTILEQAPFSVDAKARIHDIPVIYSLAFSDTPLSTIKNKAGLREAISTADHKQERFVALDERTLDFVAVYFQKFLASSPDPAHAEYLASNASRLVVQPKLPTAKKPAGPKPERKSKSKAAASNSSPIGASEALQSDGSLLDSQVPTPRKAPRP